LPGTLHVLVFADGHPPALRYGATSHLLPATIQGRDWRAALSAAGQLPIPLANVGTAPREGRVGKYKMF
jgi:hypothetical protein